jgi:DHA1 family inner membrane transport protein
MTGRGAFAPWLVAQWLTIAPQAMAPIAFALATVGGSGDVGTGAAMMAAMTGCQIALALPLSSWGRRVPPLAFVRVLVLARGGAFALVAAAIALEAPAAALICLAGAAGAANGAIFGVYRTVLSSIVEPSRLPRAIALTATSAEIVFALGPVLAAVIAGLSPTAVLALMALSASLPALLLRRLPVLPPPGRDVARAGPLSRALPVWLLCALAGSSAVACVETGAVALALRFGREAAFGAVFALVVCIASVAGGAAVTWANRTLPLGAVLALLATMTTGSLALALSSSIAPAMIGTVLIGLCMAPVGTYYSITVERLAAPDRRSEAFAVLRAAQGTGVVTTALLLTVLPIARVGLVATALLAVAMAAVVLTRRFVERERVGFLSALEPDAPAAPLR